MLIPLLLLGCLFVYGYAHLGSAQIDYIDADWESIE